MIARAFKRWSRAPLLLLALASVAASSDASDRGVVFYFTGDGTGTYKDVAGVSHGAGTLVASTYPGADSGTGYVFVQIGQTSQAAASIHIARGGGITTVTAKCQGRRRDPNNPALFTGWAPVQTVRSDTAAVSFEQAILATDPVDLRLLTADQVLTGDFRCIAKAAGVPAAGDVVAIALNAF